MGAGKKSSESLKSYVALVPFWAMSLLDLVHINVIFLFRKTDYFLMKEKVVYTFFCTFEKLKKSNVFYVIGNTKNIFSYTVRGFDPIPRLRARPKCLF